jgi:hypothetical protein
MMSGMSEYDLDAELANLLREEKAKTAFYTESLNSDISSIRESFYDHAVALYSVETTSATTNGEDEDEYESTHDELLRLTLSDIDRYETLHDGEVRISGEGLYLFDSDEWERAQIGVIDETVIIHGKIGYYSVAPMIDYATFLKIKNGALEDEVVEEDESGAPGLWVTLNEVVFENAARDQEEIDRIIIPITFKGLSFEKVVRQPGATTEVNDQPRDTGEHLLEDLREKFQGEAFLEMCNRIENDLNYNEYTPGEREVAWREHQNNLIEWSQEVGVERQLLISAKDALQFDGERTELECDLAYYAAPTIVKLPGDLLGDKWRVVHGFTVIYEKEGNKSVLVTPLQITDVYGL